MYYIIYLLYIFYNLMYLFCGVLVEFYSPNFTPSIEIVEGGGAPSQHAGTPTGGANMHFHKSFYFFYLTVWLPTHDQT